MRRDRRCARRSRATALAAFAALWLPLCLPAPAAVAGQPSGGRVLAFGGNLQGELGPPSPMNDPTPHPVTLPAAAGGAAAIAAGAGHSLVIGQNGRLYAFGSNTYGQLGSGANLGASIPHPAPTPIALPGRVAQAVGGEDFTLALTTGGQLYSFGNNVLGELGRGIDDGGGDVPRPTPAPVPLPGAVHTMSAGEFHALAITAGDRLFSWGENNFGQLGVPTNAGTATPVSAPVQVPLTHTGRFVAVAAGGEHSLVLTSTGEVFAFGNDRYGQLGRPASASGYDPSAALVRFPGLAGKIVAIAAGQEHSLALSSSGQLYGFGDNRSGRLGRAAGDATDSVNATPAIVPLPKGAGAVVQVAAGADYTAALTATGRLYAFGANTYGQLGSAANNGTDHANATPRRVSIPGGATIATVASSADSAHTLALTGTPASGATLRLGRVALAGATARITVTCTVAPPQRCVGALTGTSTGHRAVTVLHRHYAIAAGQTAQITVSLNRAGRRLLDRSYRLAVRLFAGGSRPVQTVRFHYTIIRAPISYFWNFGPAYTTVGNLTASGLKSSWRVTLSCHGGGCPLGHHTLQVRHGRASATAALRGAHLRAGAVVQLAIGARNAVTEVLRFTIAAGRLPRTRALCQTPDQRRPVACHS